MRSAVPLILIAVAAVALWLGRAQCQELEDPAAAREALVRHLEDEGISDARVLEAMRAVPRHELVPAEYQSRSYDDRPLPIGHQQTISQPYIVAYMTEMLDLEATDKVLEVGTGSGYQAAVLAELVTEVYSIEIVPELGRRAAEQLSAMGYENVHVRIGDGYQGWPEHAPFDAIIVTAAPDHVPQPLIDQLAVGARLVIPVGEGVQRLILIQRTETGVERRDDLPVRFVPMTGEAERR